MTQPPPGTNVQVDMSRVLQRATAGVAQYIAELTAELAMAREVIDQQQNRLAQLEQRPTPTPED